MTFCNIVDVDLGDDSGSRRVGLKLAYGLNLAVGGDRTDHVLVVDGGGAYLDQITGGGPEDDVSKNCNGKKNGP